MGFSTIDPQNDFSFNSQSMNKMHLCAVLLKTVHGSNYLKWTRNGQEMRSLRCLKIIQLFINKISYISYSPDVLACFTVDS